MDREKLKAKIAGNPKHVRFEELDRLLRLYGFEPRIPKRGTSHVIYKHGALLISVPKHRPHLKENYVREALKLIEVEESERRASGEKD